MQKKNTYLYDSQRDGHLLCVLILFQCAARTHDGTQARARVLSAKLGARRRVNNKTNSIKTFSTISGAYATDGPAPTKKINNIRML